MIEAGHFAELENILCLTLLESKYVPSSSHFLYHTLLVEANIYQKNLMRTSKQKSKKISKRASKTDYKN
jgi:hypothetical protein